MRVILTFLLCAAGLLAQQTTGAVRGNVTDPTGAAVVGVLLTAANTATGATFTATSDGTGSYSFPLLPPGLYTVTAEIRGFQKVTRENVLVRITETEVVNFGLQVGAVAESVTVTSSVSLVQVDSSSEGKVIERATISALPLSTRNFTQLLGLTAGVLTEPFNAENTGFGTQNP
ncbi:MAG: carboxypeptidase-like regulatory domain-containing protein, partial [Bryobacteraceae bacterium]